MKIITIKDVNPFEIISKKAYASHNSRINSLIPKSSKISEIGAYIYVTILSSISVFVFAVNRRTTRSMIKMTSFERMRYMSRIIAAERYLLILMMSCIDCVTTVICSASMFDSNRTWFKYFSRCFQNRKEKNERSYYFIQSLTSLSFIAFSV